MFNRNKRLLVLLLFLCIFLSVTLVCANNTTNEYVQSDTQNKIFEDNELNNSNNCSDEDSINQGIVYIDPNQPTKIRAVNHGSTVHNINDNSSNNKNKKSSVKFIAKNKIFSKKTKNKKYSVILKNSKNKTIKNTWITLKIKGKILKAKTNSKGKATFKIKINKKGTYKTTIKFKGNTKYKSLTKKIKIKIK